MKCLLVALAVLALGGCTETRFESPLGAQSQACDPRWKGLWTGEDPADRDAAIYVDRACKLFIIDKPAPDKPVRRIELPAQFVHIDDKDYLSVAASALAPLTDLKAPFGIEPPPAQAYFFARYRIDGKQLQIEQVNSERVASLVIADKLDGTVSKTHGELHVFVRGDAARMLEIVRSEPIFEGSTPTAFVRSKQSVKAFERALQRNAAKKTQ